ncbi:uroporphyrinogen-III C-methyltransferase [Undibacterium sp. TS12]|uniref:uroporphyrinogen-III C-methyltransferase n=1 Tax=Undibacterium sp. TS12 TaxID=2908202 RepID=UPI001F4CCE3F|nr:uroporphyrinogen-III C-methyltransferase [Undibacterium sp. TS12]MCH8618935.1 uroporphyrinogen-III C-methyltransferase [Undibacterium sp. TS12]
MTANSVDATTRQPAPALPAEAVKEPGWANPVYLVSGVLAVLLAANWWTSQNQISTLRAEVAQRLQNADTNSSETKVLARNVQDTAKEIQSKVILLEGKQSEAQSQQLALEQLYQDLSKNRDDWALAEIEQVLATASQQLQLAGNVPGALIALQNADSRLAKSDKPQFISIRRAIAKDIERLKSLPALDLPGVALRLDSVIAQIDHIPLWADEKAVITATPPKAPLRVLPKSAGNAKSDKKTVDDIEESTWTMRLQDGWQSFSSEMWSEVKQLIRVRNVETPDVLLLTPQQSYFARENLKLRLLNARLALLSRNESIFRSDMIAAQDAIAKYFDTRAKQTQTVQALLRQVQGSNLSIEMPTLAESLNAVRNYKVKP